MHSVWFDWGGGEGYRYVSRLYKPGQPLAGL